MPVLKKSLFYLSVLAALIGQGCNRDAGEAVQSGVIIPENRSMPAATTAELVYVGRQACGECHLKETALYKGSHHDLAMQKAGAETILGDFNQATFGYNGITSSFTHRDGRYFVQTDDDKGKLAEFEIRYTFGVTPLQQYLIESPGGRLQALSIAWDSRPRAEGGQRWFHLYPDEKVDHTDALHWTGHNQNWNVMCAECHSTGLKKNFNPDTNSYHTTWSEIDVSCEACHGPGSRHVRLARDPAHAGSGPGTGLSIDFKPARQGRWILGENDAIARLDTGRNSDLLIDVCARCHSRRMSITADTTAGHSIHDNYDVALLEPGLYYPDGQVDGEVYEYGSFVQSKMYAAGVNCSDCHDPHSSRLRFQGNAVCGQCHRPTMYDTPRHHFHTADSAAARCSNCHMPVKNFMVIDSRHDHSFRIPRPDLSIKTGVPNACNQCHREKTPLWASAAIQKWYGHDHNEFHFAEALKAARQDEPDVVEKLKQVVSDTSMPAIVRATAISHLGAYLDATTSPLLITNLRSPDPMIRTAALLSLTDLPSADRLPVMQELLADPVKSVRIQAARLLASHHEDSLPKPRHGQLAAAIKEYIEAQKVNSDQAYAQVNLGNLYVEMRSFNAAQAGYEQAIRIDKNFLPAYINLAELFRLQGHDAQAVTVLRLALTVLPDAALAYHALGLALVRQENHAEALPVLARAATLEPENLRFQMVYAIALNSSGDRKDALAILTDAYRRHPLDRDLLLILATLHRDLGDGNAALDYATQLARISPALDPQAQALLTEIKRRFGKD